MRRRLITWAVGNAWKGLSSDLIKKAFKQCGIGLPVDGSADHDVKIKGLPTASFEGWQGYKPKTYEMKLEAAAAAEVKMIENDVIDFIN